MSRAQRKHQKALFSLFDKEDKACFDTQRKGDSVSTKTPKAEFWIPPTVTEPLYLRAPKSTTMHLVTKMDDKGTLCFSIHLVKRKERFDLEFPGFIQPPSSVRTSSDLSTFLLSLDRLRIHISPPSGYDDGSTVFVELEAGARSPENPPFIALVPFCDVEFFLVRRSSTKKAIKAKK